MSENTRVPALAAEGLTWTYEHSTTPTLEDVSLTVEEGECLGIVGPNESGKTTFLYCLQGLIPHNFNGIWKGSVTVFGRETAKMSSLERAAEVGLVFADPEAQFTAMTVEEELVFGLENLGLDHAEIESRLKQVSELIDLEHLFDKSPYDISGGQKQRVAIACVIAMEPKVVLLDEPTSMIDPKGKAEIFEVLRRLKATNHTIVVVEHNLEELARLADRMCLVRDGAVSPPRPTQDFFDDLEQLEEAGLQPPQVSQVFSRLRSESLYDGRLPYTVHAAAEIARGLLAHA